MGPNALKDNYGKPRSMYFDRIAKMTDAELAKECEDKIWLSAYAANNPRSDYHWHVTALYDESKKRKGDIYHEAWKRASA